MGEREIYIYMHTHIYMVTRSAPPPSPSMVYGPGIPPPLPPVGWLWVFWGFGFRVGMKGFRLPVDKGLGRVRGVGSLGLTVYVLL